MQTQCTGSRRLCGGFAEELRGRCVARSLLETVFDKSELRPVEFSLLAASSKDSHFPRAQKRLAIKRGGRRRA
jgi:hypothetical protein